MKKIIIDKSMINEINQLQENELFTLVSSANTKILQLPENYCYSSNITCFNVLTNEGYIYKYSTKILAHNSAIEFITEYKNVTGIVFKKNKHKIKKLEDLFKGDNEIMIDTTFPLIVDDFYLLDQRVVKNEQSKYDQIFFDLDNIKYPVKIKKMYMKYGYSVLFVTILKLIDGKNVDYNKIKRLYGRNHNYTYLYNFFEKLYVTELTKRGDIICNFQ